MPSTLLPGLRPAARHRGVLAWLLASLSAFAGGCDLGEQRARIAVQDFRFAPAEVRLLADRVTRLTLVNEGRESHVFESPLLTDPNVRLLSRIEPPDARHGNAWRIVPGQTLRIALKAPPGTYPFRCLVRGHRGMSGTFVIE